MMAELPLRLKFITSIAWYIASASLPVFFRTRLYTSARVATSDAVEPLSRASQIAVRGIAAFCAAVMVLVRLRSSFST